MGGLLASLGLYLPAYKAKLIEAVKNGTLADVQKLVSAGWDVNGKDKQGHDALWYAVEDGDTKKVAFLLENGATNVDAQDTSKASLLHYAAQNGDLSIVKLLVEHQAKIAQLNRYGETPLMCIIYSAINMWKSSHENKHKEVAEYLIARYDKQKIDIQDTRDGQTALHMAAWRGDAKLMAAIIAANANIDAKDYKGNTPLHMAGSFAAVQLLMNSGAKNIANDSGQLPIDLTTDHAIKGLLKGKTA
jgi:ankyrin repeat protein